MASYARALVLESLLILDFVMTVASQVDGPSASAGASPADSGGSSPSQTYYSAHGWTLWLAFGVFFPTGIIFAKYGQKWMRSAWFPFHWVIQLVGVMCATTGIGISLNKFDALKDSTHAKLGLALGVLIWTQPLLGLIRPKKGSAIRQAWYFMHWLFGTGCVILGWFNIFKGLDLYVSDWPGSGTLSGFFIAFSVQVALITFLYLFLERREHFLKQGDAEAAVKPIRNENDTDYKVQTSDSV